MITYQLAEPPHGASSHRTMASVLADRIRNDIIAGLLPPCSKLRLKDLAERYDASSVIPLREALSRLAMTGFVKVEDQRGFSVTGVSVEELRDVTETRQRIETEALRNAVANGDITWEGQVLSHYHHMSRLPMFKAGSNMEVCPAWEEAHDQFHEVILVGCTSNWLLKFAHILRDQSSRYRLLSARQESTEQRDVMAEHKALLDAILARDAERACALLNLHFGETMRRVLRQID